MPWRSWRQPNACIVKVQWPVSESKELLPSYEIVWWQGREEALSRPSGRWVQSFNIELYGPVTSFREHGGEHLMKKHKTNFIITTGSVILHSSVLFHFTTDNMRCYLLRACHFRQQNEGTFSPRTSTLLTHGLDSVPTTSESHSGVPRFEPQSQRFTALRLLLAFFGLSYQKFRWYLNPIITVSFHVLSITLFTKLPHKNKQKTNSVAWVRERTIPTERQPFVGEVNAKFCG
jgi:hypothetical protein